MCVSRFKSSTIRDFLYFIEVSSQDIGRFTKKILLPFSFCKNLFSTPSNNK